VGYRGAEAFFRARGDSVRHARGGAVARRAQAGAVLAALSDRLTRVYATPRRRRAISGARRDFSARPQDQMRVRWARSRTIAAPRLAERPLNNAVVAGAAVYGTG